MSIAHDHNQSLSVLFADDPANWEAWAPHIRSACAALGLNIVLHQNAAEPSSVDYVVYSPAHHLRDFTPFSRLKAVLSTWAGVDTIVGNPTITCPITRMSDDGLKEGMIEYVTGHVLRYHLGIDDWLARQDGTWRGKKMPPLARNRHIGIMGFGALGRACGEALAALNFTVLAYSRTAKTHAQISCFSGREGLKTVLSRSDILVLLLPDTAATHDIINTHSVDLMKPGIRLINAGRGVLIDESALLSGLEQGRIAAATLDVFKQEPLPPDHPFWAHPNVTVTPHIAAATRPETAAQVIARNIKLIEAGAPPHYLVDRTAGY